MVLSTDDWGERERAPPLMTSSYVSQTAHARYSRDINCFAGFKNRSREKQKAQSNVRRSFLQHNLHDSVMGN